MANSGEFQLGLVMAGAISAGAYTAGVMDFLIEALDAYYAAREGAGWNGPRHNVKVPVLAGASAGGMTSAISAVHFMHAMDHQRPGSDGTSPERNRLYDSWVRQIDIDKLLGRRDLARRRALVSALDSTALWEIASGSLDMAGERFKRPWVADPLAIFLTVANLRGVPYGFKLFGTGSADSYGMTNHMDAMRFAVTWNAAAPDGFRSLVPGDCPNGHWPDLARAALATGAFPVGLSPQVLSRPLADYFDRPDRRDPDFGAAGPDPYEFVSVDGGLMNNEPLELARRHLFGDNEEPDDSGGESAQRAVVMIDPFPNRIDFDPDAENSDLLLPVLLKMFDALVNQARFKPEELALAESSDNYSRFIISPSRRNAGGRQTRHAIASSTLGGFGGFFQESFRRHDYLLGRKNCRSFLRRYLALPQTNRLFDAMTAEQKTAWHVRDRSGEVRRVPDSRGQLHPALPVIPMTAELAAEEPIPEQDQPQPQRVALERIELQVRERIAALGGIAIDTELSKVLNLPLRCAARLALHFSLKDRLTRKVMTKITGGLAPLRDFDQPGQP